MNKPEKYHSRLGRDDRGGWEREILWMRGAEGVVAGVSGWGESGALQRQKRAAATQQAREVADIQAWSS